MNVGTGQARSVKAKVSVSIKPKPLKERVKARYVAGMSNRKNAKIEKISKDTVGKIVKEPDVEEHIKSLREEWYGLGQAALAAEKHQLEEKLDGHLGHQVLKDMGVVPPQQTKVKIETQPQEWTEEAGQDRQAFLVGSVLLESNQQFGVELPEGYVEKLLKTTNDVEVVEDKEKK